MRDVWKFVCSVILLCTLVGYALSQEKGRVPAAQVESDKPISLAKFSVSLQKDVSKIFPGKTKAEHDLVLAEHLKSFQEQHPGALVSFVSRISEVRWKNGIAEISLDSELPKNDEMLVQLLERRQPIAVRMDQMTATSLRKGTPVKVTAMLFLAERNANSLIRDENSKFLVPRWQEFYPVQNSRLDCWLGVYFSRDYTIEISEQVFPGARSAPLPTDEKAN